MTGSTGTAPAVAAPPTVVEAPLDGRGWDAYAAAHPNATLFHQPAWLQVVQETFGYRSISLRAQREGRTVGFLPLFLVPTLPWGKAAISTPLGVYGGAIADDLATEQALLAHATEIATERGARYLELRHERAVEGLPTRDLYVTFRRAILPDAEQNMAAIPRNQRRSIRVAQKHGLTTRVGREDLLDGFFRVYSESVRNLGSPVFPRGLFERLLKRLGEDCFILGVYREGTLLSAVLTFTYRDQVLPYYGGAIQEGIRYATNDFMYWSLLCHAMERGLKVFDFGRSKQGTGSFDFKRHWGFEPTPLAYQYRLIRQKTLPDMSPKNPKFSLAIRMWQRLPLPLTQWVGPHLVRYFP